MTKLFNLIIVKIKIKIQIGENPVAETQIYKDFQINIITDLLALTKKPLNDLKHKTIETN